ncbi:MAG: hypothetical protein SGPRY_002850, partial [Prymnesium sp.]
MYQRVWSCEHVDVMKVEWKKANYGVLPSRRSPRSWLYRLKWLQLYALGGANDGENMYGKLGEDRVGTGDVSEAESRGGEDRGRGDVAPGAANEELGNIVEQGSRRWMKSMQQT